MGGPLSGVKILDLTAVVLGAYATMMLAEMGADVIKVEPPSTDDQRGGDIMRWGGQNPLGEHSGFGPLFMAYNRGKRSVCLDLKSPADFTHLERLIRGADVIAFNRPQGSLERLGLDYERVRRLNSRIIYVNAPGFGQGGGYADLPAYDDLIQAASGAADLLPRTYGHDTPQYMPTLAADKTVAFFMINAVCAALFAREKTGQGQKIEVPMFECFTHFVMSENLYGHQYIPASGSYGYSRVLNRDRRPYATRDGWVAITPYSDQNWRDFFDLAHAQDFYNAHPEYHTYQGRTQRISELYGVMEQFTKTQTTEFWLTACFERKIPAMRVHRLDSVMEDPHLKDVDFFQVQEHPELGDVVVLKHPVHYAGTPSQTGDPAPVLGGERAEDIIWY